MMPSRSARSMQSPTHGRIARSVWLCLFCAAATVLLSAAASAQQPAPELKVNPAVALRAFEPPAETDYELGAGDEISITVAGRPELDSKKTVGPDGRITLPLGGQLELAGSTRAGAADKIEAALAPYYSRLAVTVGVERYTSNRVLLLGAVEHPGIVSFDRQPTLLELVTRGGLFSGAGQDDTNSSSGGGVGGGSGNSIRAETRRMPAIPERCIIYRGTDQVLTVDLKGLLDSGSPLADMRLKRDDVVYVPSPAERYVSVLGQVQHPGAFTLDSHTTLPELLAEAGGMTEQAGRFPDIQVVQPATGVTRLISFKDILEPARLDLTLRAGDVIFVPETGFNRKTYVLQRLSPLVTLFTAAALFNR